MQILLSFDILSGISKAFLQYVLKNKCFKISLWGSSLRDIINEKKMYK